MTTSTTLQVFNTSTSQVVVMCSVASGFEGSNYFPFYKPIEITNEYVICSISKTTTVDFINVKLMAYNSTLLSNIEILNNVVDITSSYIRIPFYDRNTLIRTYPFIQDINIHYFDNRLTFYSNQTIYLKNSNTVLTKDIYCSYSVQGSVDKLITPAYDITTSSVKCDIGIFNLNNPSTLIDISLTYILTNDTDVLGTFVGSQNLISFQTIYTPLQFNITNSTSNLLLDVNNLNIPIATNYFIPSSMPFTIVVQNENSTMIDLKCNTLGYASALNCVFSKPKFNQIPDYVHTKLIITDTRSGESISYALTPVLYYEKLDFVKLYPFILPFREKEQKKIYYQFNRMINQQINQIEYYLEIESSLGKNTYSSTFYKEEGDIKIYSSSIHVNSVKEENIKARFGFYIPQTTTKILLSNIDSTIFAIDKLIFSNKDKLYYSLPVNSKSLIQSKIPVVYTTKFSNILDYKYDFKMNYKGKYLSLLYNNTYSMNSQGDIQFLLNNNLFDSKLSSSVLPNDFGVDLFINDKRSFTLFGKITLYDIPIIEKILPSENVLIGTNNNNQYIYLISNQFTFQTVKNATIYYSCLNASELQCTINGNVGGSAVEKQSCYLLELKTLCCHAPTTFNWNFTASSFLPISMSLTLNGKDIMPLAKQFSLFIKNNIAIHSLSDYEFYREKNKDIFIYGNRFIKPLFPSALKITLYDDVITKIIHNTLSSDEYITFINDKTIKLKTPLLYDENIQFPRRFKIAVSFDDGKSYITNNQIIITAKDLTTENAPVTIESPLYVPTNITIQSLIIKNFPTLNDISLKSEEKLVLEIYNDNYNAEMNCTENLISLICTASTPSLAGTLSLRAFIVSTNIGVERKPFYFKLSNFITVYNKPSVTNVTPKYVLKSSKKTITLYGSFSVVPISNVKFQFVTNNPIVRTRNIKDTTATTIDATNSFAINYLSIEKIEFVIVSIEQLNSVPFQSSLQISFDNGTNYNSIVNDFYLLEDFTILYLRNDLTEDSRGFYTFRETPVTLGGLNLPLTNINNYCKLKMKTRFYEKTYLPNDFNGGITIDTISQTLKFKMPTFEQFINGSDIIDPQSPILDFPMSVIVSITFNDYDYKEISSKYLDRYQEVIITSVIPNTIPRINNYLLRIEGSNLNEAISCLFTSKEFIFGQENVIVPIDNSGNSDISTTIRYCKMPLMPRNVNNVYLSLINNRNETSKNPSKITYYENPRMGIGYSPSIVPTHALVTTQQKMSLKVLIDNYRTDLTLYAKFGTIFSSEDKCKLMEYNSNGFSVECPILPHEAGTVPICVSYNRNDWYGVNGLPCDSLEAQNYNVTMTYYPCDKGYTAHTYKEICYKCPRGTYKPTSGIYSCVGCELNYYNENEGSTACSPCPRFSITENRGTTNLTQCLCLKDYYHNPNVDNAVMFLNPLDYYCLPCPPGGICNETGTYKPIAEYGFWHTNESIYTEYQFYECFPHASCGGMTLNNCSNGYTGINCGVCARGYYRWRNGCQECESYAWLKILLLLIGIGIVSVAFLAFSSIKISHLASISIAFSYTQVISMFSSFDIQWPWAMGDVFVASSITNFNISFVSPECWIPDISYFTRWLITSLLPFYFGAAFILLYLIGITRSFIASKIGHKIKWKYLAPYEDETERPDYDEKVENSRFEYMTLKQKLKYTSKMYLKKFGRMIMNFLIWLRNFGVWSLKQKQSKDELRVFLNMIMNSYTSFLSFCFVFIMTNASQTFVCNKQSTGDYTLQASPDILCFGNDERWLTMLPISIIFYIIFGLGGALFFIAIYIMKKTFVHKINKLNRDEDGNEIVNLKKCKTKKEKIMKENYLLERDPKLKIQYKNFYQRLKFIIKRFRRKYFYWESIITLRKLIISILHIFLKPLVVIVMAIAVIFIAMILQMWFVPFKHKFHNIMEYFVLMATLIVLFFGLLFFVKSFPAPWIETAAVWIAVIVIIVSIIFVCLMALHDVLTRLRTDRIKKRKLRQTLISKFGEEQAKKHLKEYESNLFTKSTKTIIEDLDEENDNPWIIIENEYCRIVQEELMQFKEEDWYNNDNLMMDITNNYKLREKKKEENDRWIITENQLRKELEKHEDKDDWIVLQNPLNEQNQFDYEQLEMKIYHVQFNLPFFEEEGQDESSDEDRANSINDILDNLFSKERIDKKKKAIKKQFVKFKNSYLTTKSKRDEGVEQDEEEIKELRLLDDNNKDNNGEELELDEIVITAKHSEVILNNKEDNKKEQDTK